MPVFGEAAKKSEKERKRNGFGNKMIFPFDIMCGRNEIKMRYVYEIE